MIWLSTFALKYWRYLIPLAGLFVIALVLWRANDAAYNRGHAAAAAECAQERAKAEETVRAALAKAEAEGKAAGVEEGKRLAESETKTRVETRTVIRRIAGAVERVVVKECPLDPAAVTEITNTLNERRRAINGEVKVP